MNTFPLTRVKWSNEHVMAAVFGVSVLYMLPSLLQNPLGILRFSAIIIISLVLDVAINMVRYKRPICAVSASVTASILYILTPGVPLGGQLLGAATALIVGKHIWGGTGKNSVNPAMVGILFISLLFEIREPIFNYTLLILPAMVLSVPFIRFRPFAALSFMVGMMAALLYNQEFGLNALIVYGVIFWGCLVLTDPVTITANPVIGAVGGIVTGFFSMQLSGSVLAMAIGVLFLNILSAAAEKFLMKQNRRIFSKSRINKIMPLLNGPISFLNLTEEGDGEEEDITFISTEEMLRRIKINEVFGLGGAAFPTIDKIEAVMCSGESSRHLIINGVECDPGLVHDYWLMRRCINEIYMGIDILKKCVGFKSITLAVKDIADFRCITDLSLYQIPNYYPAGAEKILIREVLGKDLSRNEIPSKQGILVLNVQTIYSIYEAVCRNKKASTKLITVADMKGESMYVAKVELGSSVQSIVDALPLKSGNVFLGGGAMQCRNADNEDVIDKNTNFIAFGDFPRYKESPLCSKCGFCRDSCPEGLMIDRIAELVYMGDWKNTKKYKPEKCIQCGNCSRVCLAGRNLAAQVKTAKEKFMECEQ